MSDLESQIQSWRRGMRASGINPSGTLDELEDHLRGDIERRMRLGAGAQRAFEMAAESIGQPRTLRSEFQKIQLLPIMSPATHRRLRHILVIIALIAMSVALILPNVAKFRAHETLAATDIMLGVIGVLIIPLGAMMARKTLLKS